MAAVNLEHLLRAAKTVLVIDWPTRDVPESLARAGLRVFSLRWARPGRFLRIRARWGRCREPQARAGVCRQRRAGGSRERPVRMSGSERVLGCGGIYELGASTGGSLRADVRDQGVCGRCCSQDHKNRL